jgi:hypothetical protein
MQLDHHIKQLRSAYFARNDLAIIGYPIKVEGLFAQIDCQCLHFSELLSPVSKTSYVA